MTYMTALIPLLRVLLSISLAVVLMLWPPLSLLDGGAKFVSFVVDDGGNHVLEDAPNETRRRRRRQEPFRRLAAGIAKDIRRHFDKADG